MWSTSTRHEQPLSRVSVIGIDGAGKSTAGRAAQLELSTLHPGFTSLEIDRHAHLIQDGIAKPVGSALLSRAAAHIDGPGTRMIARARYAQAMARVGAEPNRVTDDRLNTILSIRDPLIDSVVFARHKLPTIPSRVALQGIKSAFRSSWPNAVVWLDLDPDCAMERISRSAGERTNLGEQSHETTASLRTMRGYYADAVATLGTIAPSQIIRIDAEQSYEAVCGELQTVLANFASPPMTPTR